MILSLLCDILNVELEGRFDNMSLLVPFQISFKFCLLLGLFIIWILEDDVIALKM